jgi:hypothetical protein
MRSIILGMFLGAIIGTGATAETDKPAAGGADSGDTSTVGANVRLSATTLAVWSSQKPPAGAKTKKSAGAGRTAVDTANPEDSGDSFWISTIDVDGDGNTEDVELLYDDEDRILFIYASKSFACLGSGTGTGEMLIAVNTDGNPRKRPAGSGWYAVALDAGECGAKMEGIYGCRFDAKGNPTLCGAATLDAKHDDLVLATVE